MNSAETTVYDTLRNNAGVTALVLQRIHHKFVPLASDDSLPPPSIAFIRSSTEFTNTIHAAAPVAGRIGIDIHCIAPSDGVASSLADAVIAIPTTAWRIFNRSDQSDPETGLHSTTVTVEVWER